MLQIKVKDVSDEQLNNLFITALQWLATEFGEDSKYLNKQNYAKNRSPLRDVFTKAHLNLKWARKTYSLNWYYYGQFAEYDYASNTIKVLCLKHYTIEFILDSLFHEYKHSQQSMKGYNYYDEVLKISYYTNPYEKEANDFAKANVEKFCKYYEKEFGSLI